MLTWEVVVGDVHVCTTAEFGKVELYISWYWGCDQLRVALSDRTMGIVFPTPGADPEGTSNAHAWRLQKSSDELDHML